MQEKDKIIDCYNRTAENYAAKYKDELDKKHLDRILLRSFAIENSTNGKFIDLGCGPGQTTKYLYDYGITDIIGTDISPVMVEVARNIHPGIHFETADMLNLNYPSKSFGSAIAFYSIVHFVDAQIKKAFSEIRNILADNGQFLFSFHIGNETVHLDDFLEQPVDIDFYFFETARITELLADTGFTTIDIIERQPYIEFEYPSRRAYIWAKATGLAT